ncbi:MAG: hypothetical protein FGM24_01170 [Candidatus Kapabacteria bacterium]|nr:hypothetical protein [Candidatus Kapabacteria bacterium]
MIRSLVVLLLLAVQAASAVEVTLVLLPRANDGSVFALGQVYQGRSGGGFYRPELLRYYISGITVHHDGTSTRLIDHYLLVDVSKSDRYSLGDLAVQRIDSISFSIGVDIAHNHLDPASYPDGHPLGYQDPSMHWGWESGYRFVTYEAMAGTQADKLTAMMQIHSVDDALYTGLTVRAGSTRTEDGIDIPLICSYEYLLESINVSRGLVNHSAQGEAITLMQNMARRVYSGAVVSSVKEQHDLVTIAPNPASDVIVLPTDVRQATIIDIAGNAVATANLSEGASLMSVHHLPTGIYGIVMHHADARRTHATVAINR